MVVESRFRPGSANGVISEPLTELGELFYRVVAITGTRMRVQTHHPFGGGPGLRSIAARESSSACPRVSRESEHRKAYEIPDPPRRGPPCDDRSAPRAARIPFKSEPSHSRAPPASSVRLSDATRRPGPTTQRGPRPAVTAW